MNNMKNFLDLYLKRLRLEKPSFLNGISKVTFSYHFPKSSLPEGYPNDDEVIKSDWWVVGEDIKEAVKKYEKQSIDKEQLRLSFK